MYQYRANVITLSCRSTLLHFQLKIITLSGSKFITLPGDIITLSGSYYIIGCFYYIVGQLLPEQAIITYTYQL